MPEHETEGDGCHQGRGFDFLSSPPEKAEARSFCCESVHRKSFLTNIKSFSPQRTQGTQGITTGFPGAPLCPLWLKTFHWLEPCQPLKAISGRPGSSIHVNPVFANTNQIIQQVVGGKILFSLRSVQYDGIEIPVPKAIAFDVRGRN